MIHKAKTILVLLSAVVLAAALSPRSPRAQDYTGTRTGTIDSISKVEGTITLNVTLQGELAQPSNPELSTGVADPSEVTSFTDGKTQVLAGMPVALVIVSQGGSWTPTIGTVDSVVDPRHVVVRVDASALERTWQDPADASNTHKAGEYLQEGASVSIAGVTNQ